MEDSRKIMETFLVWSGSMKNLSATMKPEHFHTSSIVSGSWFESWIKYLRFKPVNSFNRVWLINQISRFHLKILIYIYPKFKLALLSDCCFHSAGQVEGRGLRFEKSIYLK